MRMLLSGILLFPFVSACYAIAPDFEEEETPLWAVMKLNKNVDGLRTLANACMYADSVASYCFEYNDDGSNLYWLRMKEAGEVELYGDIIDKGVCVPELSINLVGSVFYWFINGEFLTDSEGERIAVTDVSNPVSFFLNDETIYCKVKDSVVGEYSNIKSSSLDKDVEIGYDNDNRLFNVCLSSGFRTKLPAIADFHLLDENVPNRSFYKDVFLDAGIALTSRKSLAAAEYLGLSLEGISFSQTTNDSRDIAMQQAIVAGDSEDLNGRLLYPDGQPRYKMLFVNGGHSRNHGKSLGEKALNNMRTFVKNGGCYVGTCAGAFFASNGYDGHANYQYYLSIWPGMTNGTGLENIYTGMFIEKNSPLTQYYDFGGDYYVDSIRHNTGGYPADFPLRTEILARYDYSKNKGIHRKPSIWAYKESFRAGRVIMEGSHPEEVTNGERRDLTAAMMLYAMDGVGMTTLKGFLKNGEERVMDKQTSDNNPAYTRIGDLQTHHFAAYIPSDARNIRVELDGPDDYDFALLMNQKTYAFSDVAEYRSVVPGATQQLIFPTIRDGLWFIAVQCLTTVTITETDYGQEYGGKTDVLNGVPYRIRISWE